MVTNELCFLICLLVFLFGVACGIVIGIKAEWKSISKMINISHLQDLHNRLVDNYNNGTEFEQYEEDRLELGKVIEMLESVGDSE